MIPENIETNIFIKKFIGSDCLKYKTNDSAKKDNAKKGMSITAIKKKEVRTEEIEKESSPIS